MATTTYLANPVFSVGAAVGSKVDLSDQTKSVVLTRTIEALESTAFGATERVYTAGLGNHQCVVTMLFSYANSEPYLTLAGLVGTQCYVEAKPTSASTGANNPAFSLTNTYLESLDVVNASLGELSEVQLTFIGGAYAAATT
jgi:hypothetical protein